MVSVAEMRDRLFSVDRLKEILAETEPVSGLGVPVGDSLRFEVEDNWNRDLERKTGTDLVDASIFVGSGSDAHEYRLTKDALLEAGLACNLNRKYMSLVPGALIEPHLNYWYRGGLGDKEFQLLTVGNDQAVALTRATLKPFSNLRLVNELLDGIHAKYGNDSEVLVDYKFDHSLRGTHLRLIIPDYVRTINGTGTEDDNWSVGVELRNSLVGEEQTVINGYLFRWWCTNGAIDIKNSSGAWSRRGAGGQTDMVYEWARDAVDQVLGGLESSLDAVEDMAHTPLSNEAANVLRDVMADVSVPARVKDQVTQAMVNEDNLTMYTLMQAITAAANHDDVAPGHAIALMEAGGNLTHNINHRCGECRRMLVS